jgi:hypothetical protein
MVFMNIMIKAQVIHQAGEKYEQVKVMAQAPAWMQTK